MYRQYYLKQKFSKLHDCNWFKISIKVLLKDEEIVTALLKVVANAKDRQLCCLKEGDKNWWICICMKLYLYENLYPLDTNKLNIYFVAFMSYVAASG